MNRQNFLSEEPWDEMHEDLQMRTRVFSRRADDMLSASLHELSPGSPGFRLHMHYGAEEMFFVLSGTPTFRDGQTEERLAPGDVVHCPEGRDGLHTFANTRVGSSASWQSSRCSTAESSTRRSCVETLRSRRSMR